MAPLPPTANFLCSEEGSKLPPAFAALQTLSCCIRTPAAHPAYPCKPLCMSLCMPIYTPVHTPAGPCTPLCIPIHTHVHTPAGMHAPAYPFILLCISLHTLFGSLPSFASGGKPLRFTTVHRKRTPLRFGFPTIEAGHTPL